MEEMNKAEKNSESFDLKKCIRTLADSLAFTGSANVHMVKTRRDFIKKEMPKTMQALCGDGFEFSGSYLFGNNLTAAIKEVSELNKVSRGMNVRGRARGRGGFFRGRARFSENLLEVDFHTNAVEAILDTPLKPSGSKALNWSRPSSRD